MVRFEHHPTVDIIAPFGDEKENDAQNDVTDIWEKVVEIGEIDAAQSVRISACEIIVANILVASRQHQLQHDSLKTNHMLQLLTGEVTNYSTESFTYW